MRRILVLAALVASTSAQANVFLCRAPGVSEVTINTNFWTWGWRDKTGELHETEANDTWSFDTTTRDDLEVVIRIAAVSTLDKKRPAMFSITAGDRHTNVLGTCQFLTTGRTPGP
jgi:hypothetical protein